MAHRPNSLREHIAALGQLGNTVSWRNAARQNQATGPAPTPKSSPAPDSHLTAAVKRPQELIKSDAPQYDATKRTSKEMEGIRVTQASQSSEIWQTSTSTSPKNG